MKIEEAIIDGNKVSVVVDFDDDLIEKIYIDEEDENNDLENTIDLSETVELVIEGLND